VIAINSIFSVDRRLDQQTRNPKPEIRKKTEIRSPNKPHANPKTALLQAEPAGA
jgi:hypothetical protein